MKGFSHIIGGLGEWEGEYVRHALVDMGLMVVFVRMRNGHEIMYW